MEGMKAEKERRKREREGECATVTYIELYICDFVMILVNLIMSPFIPRICQLHSHHC